VPQGGTILLGAPENLDQWDGQAYYGKQWQVEYLTMNCLVDVDPNPGDKTNPAFIPGLATELPTATNDGKTYTFTIRDGLKYSDGTPVQAQDVKDYMERILDPAMGYDGALGSGYYNNIVGMDKYAPTDATAAGAQHIDGITVSGNQVTFNLVKADPDFLAEMSLRFVCPQKPGGPHKRVQAPNPSTGPYMVQSVDEKHLNLVRNPYWWDNAKIMGLDKYKGQLWNADGFNFAIGASGDQLLLQAKNNQVDMDWTNDAVSSLAIRKQIESDPTLSKQFRADVDPFIRYYSLNTKIPPFDNVKLRQAVNYAVNRQALIAINGNGIPWSIIVGKALAPNAQNPFPPTPDIAKAKQLIQESGVPTPIKITLIHGDVPPAPQLGAALKAQLEAVGFQVTEKTHPRQGYYPYASDDKNNLNIMAAGWAPDWIDGAAALGPTFTAAGIGGQNLARFNNPDFEAGFKAADQIPYTPPEPRAQAWADLATKTSAEQAPAIVWLQEEELNLNSARLGGFTYDGTHLVNMATLYLKQQ
jgi:peptide/nickel transport system substrate-binding protein